LVSLFRYLNSDVNERPGTLRLARDLQPEGAAMPRSWMGADGDGRARGGRDRVWICGDVMLVVKVSCSFEDILYGMYS
jgi:hypothetical protein